jgi:uncharacterized protein (DUF169 family)
MTCIPEFFFTGLAGQQSKCLQHNRTLALTSHGQFSSNLAVSFSTSEFEREREREPFLGSHCHVYERARKEERSIRRQISLFTCPSKRNVRQRNNTTH